MALWPVENLVPLALSLSHSRLNIYLTRKVLRGTETHPYFRSKECLQSTLKTESAIQVLAITIFKIQ